MNRLISIFQTLAAKLPNIQLNQMTLDSRKVGKNDVFVALKGHSVDGRNFIPKAIEQGATLVLAEAETDVQAVEIAKDFTNSTACLFFDKQIAIIFPIPFVTRNRHVFRFIGYSHADQPA